MRFLLVLLLAAVSAPVAADDLPKLLPRQLEIDIALSALPPHLRADAAVLVLERGGLVEGKSGTNGFVCTVRRAGALPIVFEDSIVPICYDAEGARTLLVAIRDEVRLLEQGLPASEVATEISRGWQDGTYHAPGPGVAYMLSPAFKLKRPGSEPGSYIPHLMIYAAGRTNAEIGSDGNRFGYVPFMQVEGQPSSMMVLPVGEREREAIRAQEAGLLERAAEWLK